MKNNTLVVVYTLIALVFTACTSNPVNRKLEGTWQSKDRATKLIITDKGFTTEEDGKPVTEDYFVKKDTIYTSYEGSRPYTTFYIKNLDDHKLILLYPDSDVVEFSR